MTRNLVSCPLAALLSPRALESLLGSFASSQQKGKESTAWRTGSSTPHHHPHSTGQNSITWPHQTAREAGKCSLCRSNKLSGMEDAPFFCSTLWLDLALGKSRGQIHISIFKTVVIPLAVSCLRIWKGIETWKVPRGTIWSSLFRQGHCITPHVIDHLPNVTQLVYGRAAIRM